MLKRWNFLKTGFYEGINDAFGSHSGGTDVRPTFEYIRSNSGERRSQRLVHDGSDGTNRMGLRDPLLEVHEQQHRRLWLTSAAHLYDTSIASWGILPLHRGGILPYRFRSLLS